MHYWNIPVSAGDEYDVKDVDVIAREREYKNQGVITVSREGLGETYEGKIKMLFGEHMREDKEIRYILGGTRFFDV
ncbi:hypothetical protein NEOLEDRAFT_1182521 [Neolentinus lepideus HHB14362 ss-1]|uniref:Uncharacterized protein n=1 Tax=Neolentinus lepideus HHB14362 ss-1 TaxID=1314782 RepID=A0A165P2Q0_9AGAM|nr:hypothetical protein NEOLEDRAFT_1182521 [Neolentinus lepideus HHB14362 ss-1]